MAAIHAPPPPDRVRHPSWRRLLLFAGIAFIGIASLPLLDEALLSTPRERALERRIGTPILPGWLDSGRERDRKVLLFERIYDGARRNWDLFPGHFARVDAVFINDEDADFVAASSRILGLDLVFINSRREEAAEVEDRGGRFEDVTDTLAPGLREVGMVTSALWSDVDGDGWPDLLLTLEWGA